MPAGEKWHGEAVSGEVLTAKTETRRQFENDTSLPCRFFWSSPFPTTFIFGIAQ